MKIGDLVKYRGWSKQNTKEPMAIVVNQNNAESDFHHRIRVMWLGDQVPAQASVISVTGSRFSSWVSPKYFEVVNEAG